MGRVRLALQELRWLVADRIDLWLARQHGPVPNLLEEPVCLICRIAWPCQTSMEAYERLRLRLIAMRPRPHFPLGYLTRRHSP